VLLPSNVQSEYVAGGENVQTTILEEHLQFKPL